MQVTFSEKVLESQRKAHGLAELLWMGETLSCRLLGSDVNTFYTCPM